MNSRLNHIGRLQAAPTWHIAAHRHPFHQLICVVRGRMSVRLEGTQLSARAGEFLLYPTGEAHEEWAETAKLETLYIGFDWAALPPGAPRQGLDARGRLRPLMEWLLEDRDARQPAEVERRQSLLTAFVAELEGLLTRPGPGLVARTRAYVRAHLADSIRVEDLADLAGISKFHFIRAYTAQAGVTPMADVRAMRLDAARHRILTTDLPLKVIAPEVGLASEFHLSRLLQTHFGAGVRQLRRT
ncbi:MAG TPA: AraC family transcriptional regulator [Planctomycetota bacterium]|nr:AraC family transcriptional regulator [Planctomycetota bacterium]